MMRKLTALMALTILTACDYAERAEFRAERADKLYQAAMNDYRAGRLDAAVDGFEKAVAKNPANASARFQLACVLQDAKHDYLNAFCGYREYVLQHPESDKAKLARDRMAICEKEVAKTLAVKYGLSGSEKLLQELEKVRRELKAAETRAAATEKDLGLARGRIEALGAERTRLLAIVKGEGAAPDTVVTAAPSRKEAKDLLEETDGTAAAPSRKEAKDLLDESDEDSDRSQMTGELAALKNEEKGEVESGASLLPAHTAEDVAKRDAARAKKPAAPSAPSHPDTYVVQEGDTLYRIAKKFYGRLSAWKAIRDANRAILPADNRLRAGDTLKLPSVP